MTWKLLSCVQLFVNPMDHTVHGILQARILEWVAFPFSRGSSQPRDQTHCRRILYQLSHQGSPLKALQMPGFSCKLHSSLEEKCMLVSNHCIHSTVSLKVGSADALIYSVRTQSWSNPDFKKIKTFYLFHEIYRQIKHIIQSISLQFPILNILHLYAAFVPKDQPALIDSD